MSDRLPQVLKLVAQGFPCFPVWWITAEGVCACGQPHPDGKNAGKHPITPRGLHDATRDVAKATELWTIAPQANIGVAVPDGFAVIDVDPRNGGEATFDALQAQHGALPPTRAAETGGKGGHFWLKLAPGVALPSTLGAGIDVKQLGGYVLAPPSNHSSGGSYQWVAGADAPIADAPQWLAALGRPRGERTTVVVEDEDDRLADDATLDGIVAVVEPEYVDGKKHAIAKNLGGWMKQRGYGPGDVSYVVERLPSKNPWERAKAARAAFTIEKPFGWTELKGLIGDAPAAHLDTVTPNPRRAEAQAGASVVAAGMAASAVEVRPVVIAAPLPPPAAANADPLASLGIVRDLSVKPPPLDYVIPELELAPGRVSMVAGYSNAGKTAIVQALAFAVAMALLVWGRFFARRCRVLHLDYEAGDVVLENYARLANAHGVPLGAMAQQITVLDARTPLTAPAFEAELTAAIQRGGFGLVIVDVLRAAAGALDENTAEIALPLYMLGRVSKATGAAIIVLHHERKPDGEKRSAAEHMISGHNAIHGALQVALSLIRDEQSGLVAVRSSKRIRKGFEPFSLRFVDVGDPAERNENEVGNAVAAAGAPSWGLRVEVAPTNATAIATPEQTKERGIVEASERILAFMRERAGDGSEVRLDVIKAEVVGKDAYKVAALERLTTAGIVTGGRGSPKLYSLVVHANGYPASAVAPPAFRAPRPADPTAYENANALHEGLLQQLKASGNE